MNNYDPLGVKGDHVIQLLNSIRLSTLKIVRTDLGIETFDNCDLIRIIEKAISSRRERESLEQSKTISADPPEFWDIE